MAELRRVVPAVRAVAGPDCELIARIFVCPTADAGLAREIGRRMIAAYLTVPAYAAFHDWLSDRAQGGFYASQDADFSLDDDGDYFTWTLDEARAVLSEDEAQVAALHYDINEIGEMHHNPAKNVLYVRAPRLFEELTLCHADGSFRKRLAAIRDKRAEQAAVEGTMRKLALAVERHNRPL